MKRVKRFIDEFKEFLANSTFLDVAIGLLIAGAVKDVATSFTSAFISPIIMRILELLGVNAELNEATTIFGIDFYIGGFISSLFTFIIIMFVAFSILQGYAKFKERFKAADDLEHSEDLSKDQELLTEIRDLLKQQSLPPHN